ncbi:hypothetical protein glysoja_032177 [Glycine soja]|uniref:Transmembrane protein n=1 Tax=Glycine soja TaxID=3848 RepID=A0A0B2PMK6_GLYSO|nr:hypothetical protein glysoja_032177 [Glycine soja]
MGFVSASGFFSVICFMVVMHDMKRLGLEAKGCCVGCIVKGQYGGFGWNRDGRGLFKDVGVVKSGKRPCKGFGDSCVVGQSIVVERVCLSRKGCESYEY